MSYYPHFFFNYNYILLINKNNLFIASYHVYYFYPYFRVNMMHITTVLRNQFSKKLCGLDKERAMHVAPVVTTSAVSIPLKHSLKLALNVPGLPFLFRNGTSFFKLSVNTLLWFNY